MLVRAPSLLPALVVVAVIGAFLSGALAAATPSASSLSVPTTPRVPYHVWFSYNELAVKQYITTQIDPLFPDIAATDEQFRSAFAQARSNLEARGVSFSPVTNLTIQLFFTELDSLFPAAQRQPLLETLDNRTAERQQLVTQAYEAEIDPVRQEVTAGILQAFPSAAIDPIAGMPTLTVWLPHGTDTSAIASLPHVTGVFESPSFQGYALDISAPSIFAPTFWNAGGGGFTGYPHDVIVIDSGVHQSHPSFWFHTFYQQSFPPTCSGPRDHGTHVGGIIFTKKTLLNSLYQGIAFGVDKIFDGTVCGTNWNVVQNASNWGVVTGVGGEYADVVQLASSWGCTINGMTPAAQFVDQMVDSRDIIWVEAAGNNGKVFQYCLPPQIISPADAYNIIAVGNMDDLNTVNRADDLINSSSSQGPTADGRIKPDLVAPGSNIMSTDTGIGFVSMTGTSMAAPHVSGTALLLMASGIAVDRSLKIRALLLNSADDWGTPGPDNTYGYGYLNLLEAFVDRGFVDSATFSYPYTPHWYMMLERSSFPNKATLVWNKGTGTLDNLDLIIYRESTGGRIASSESTGDNREHIAFTSSQSGNNLILKVNDTSRTFETYGLSRAIVGLPSRQLSQPSFTIAITAPATAVINQQFTITVTATNSGEFAAHQVTAQLTLPPGLSLASGGSSIPLGTVAASATSGQAVFPVVATTVGSKQVQVDVVSSSYDEVFAAKKTTAIQVTGLPPGQLCSTGSECSSGYCEGSRSNPGRCCSSQPPADGYYGGGNTQTATCGVPDNDNPVEDRDYYCDGSGAPQYEVLASWNCNTQDGWYGGGNTPGCGPDPPSNWRDYYGSIVSQPFCSPFINVCPFSCDGQDQCSSFCQGTIAVYGLDYYVITNTSQCASSVQQEDCAQKASTDTDGGDAPLVGGICTDYNTCSGGSCQGVLSGDVCDGAGWQLTEYYPSTTSPVCATKTYACSSFERLATGGTADNPSTTTTCTAGTGASCTTDAFATTAGSSGTDRCTGTCGTGPNSCQFEEFYATDSGDTCPGLDTCTSKLYDADTVQNTCTTCRGSGYWQLGGDVQNCCGDDQNEHKNSRLCAPGVCTTNPGDVACCDQASDCVYGSVCYASGFVGDPDGNGQPQQCTAGMWSPVQCVTPTSGQAITQPTVLCPGVYSLPGGLKVRASNITLDCNGATLVGSGQQGTGIDLSAAFLTSSTIKNCKISTYANGVLLFQATSVTLTNNVIQGNTIGISLVGSNSTLVYNNVIANNTRYNVEDIPNSGQSNLYAIPKAAGTNIIGGPSLGGNFWSDYRGADVNGDGLGDTLLPHTSGGGIRTGGDGAPLTAVNNAPRLSPVGNRTVQENQLLTIQLQATDPDGDRLTFGVSATPPILSSFSFSQQTGLFQWTPTFSDSGSYNVTFTVTDGKVTVSESILITVLNVNRPPTLLSIPHQTVKENQLLTIQLQATDPDNETLAFGTNAGSVLPPGTVLFNATTGLFQWTPLAGATGNYTVLFNVTDGQATASQQVGIGVLPSCIRLQSGMSITQSGAVCPGVYQLTAGVTITAADVALDCDGATLSGPGSGTGIGSASTANNLSVTNCTVQNFMDGISVASQSSRIADNTLQGNSQYGIVLSGGGGHRVERNVAMNNGLTGIRIVYSNGNIIRNNTVIGNQYGISPLSSQGTFITGNRVTNNAAVGIGLYSSPGTTVYDNLLSNGKNAIDDAGGSAWDVAPRQGTNIIGGPLVAGNAWSDYQGYDMNGDGLGDTHLPYAVYQGTGDSHPLTTPAFYQKTSFSLQPPLTLMSLPLSPASRSTATAFAPVAAALEAVYYYNSSDPANPWRLYDPQAPAFMNTLTSVDETMSLIVKVKSAATLDVYGLPSQSAAVAIRPGWNALGFPSLQPVQASQAFSLVQGSIVWVYEISGQGTRIWSPPANQFTLQTLQPGQGYWVYATKAETWTFRNGVYVPS